MSKNLENKLEIHSHVVACYREWPLKDMWGLIKPTLRRNENGEIQAGPIARIPDGEPTHWDIVLVRGDRAYQKISEEDCLCDLTSGEICPHWREIL